MTTEPLIRKCPSCGENIRSYGCDSYGQSREVDYYRNETKTYIGYNDEAIGHTLYHVCTLCGAKWKHGQYTENNRRR